MELKKEKIFVDICIGLRSVDKITAIMQTGKYLFKRGIVEKEYIKSMVEREKVNTTYIGRGIALAHGMPGSERWIKKKGICISQYPLGIFFQTNKVYLLIGLAVDPIYDDVFFFELSDILEDNVLLEKLFKTKQKQDFYDAFNNNFERR